MNLEGIILKTYDQGEADLVVALLTYESGKVFVKARGAKKIAAKLGPHLQPLNFVALALVPPVRTRLPIVISVETLENFRGVRRSSKLLVEALAGLNLVDVFTHEGHSEPKICEALLEFLGALNSARPAAVRGAFETLAIRVLQAEGLSPQVKNCARCGRAIKGEALLSLILGGLICFDCRRFDESAKRVSARSVARFQDLADNRLSGSHDLRLLVKVFSEHVAPRPLYAFEFLSLFS